MKEDIIKLLDKASNRELHGILLFLRALLGEDGSEA